MPHATPILNSDFQPQNQTDDAGFSESVIIRCNLNRSAIFCFACCLFVAHQAVAQSSAEATAKLFNRYETEHLPTG
jgi:hypothetical protein